MHMLDSEQSSRRERRVEVLSSVSNDAEVRSELERILTSDFFKSSTRCQDFLKHVVWVACSESPESIKERTIGIAVFGRAPDYDTGADAIVRVKASEVRRRLAQYNQNADPLRPLAIELSPGSYAPKITRRIPQESLAVNVVPKRAFGKVAGAISIASVLLLLASGIYATSSAATPLKKFWRPFLGHDKPIICISHPGAYYLSIDKLARIGDSSEGFHLSEKLQNLGRSSRIAIANDLTESDLKTSPIVLIGGPRFNHWTMVLTQNLRFAFHVVDGKPRIVDRDNVTRFWETSEPGTTKAYWDYVVITRLVGSSSQRAVICVAGMTASSTRIGTEMVINPDFLDKTLKFAPEDWDRKNLQFVIRLASDKGTEIPELVAATYW